MATGSAAAANGGESATPNRRRTRAADWRSAIDGRSPARRTKASSSVAGSCNTVRQRCHMTAPATEQPSAGTGGQVVDPPPGRRPGRPPPTPRRPSSCARPTAPARGHRRCRRRSPVAGRRAGEHDHVLALRLTRRRPLVRFPQPAPPHLLVGLGELAGDHHPPLDAHDLDVGRRGCEPGGGAPRTAGSSARRRLLEPAALCGPSPCGAGTPRT